MAVCLGFDYGVKKIGVAVGDTETNIANALTTVKAINQKTGWDEISKLVNTWQPTKMVVGISHQEDGSDNEVTPRMVRFSRQLEGRYQCPVELFDETLTTFESKQMLFDEVKVSATKLWQVQDQLAAQLILQSWLNTKQQGA
ncbi:MAG: Holliday junction resolvase RuvX [Cycloclasticus sp.]|jgi:putative Holliday junction resolvase|nr:Holliday junction resolvase RuvX [Cycloclasticus sp.]|tara:strand:+ start:64 stop:489 length:426 start_codon:yes stop_codon:yes gene_type:complete